MLEKSKLADQGQDVCPASKEGFCNRDLCWEVIARQAVEGSLAESIPSLADLATDLVNEGARWSLGDRYQGVASFSDVLQLTDCINMGGVAIPGEMLHVGGLWNVELCSVLVGRLSRVTLAGTPLRLVAVAWSLTCWQLRGRPSAPIRVATYHDGLYCEV